MRSGKGSERPRRGAGRADRERQELRERRYAQRLEREGRAPPRPPSVPPAPLFEAEVVPGLETFAREELRRLLGPRLPLRPGSAPGVLAFPFRGDAALLKTLGTVTAVYRVHRFNVPRPRALLGEEQLGQLLELIRSTVARYPDGSFQSFRFSAAGAGSAVFLRLGEELERRTGLRSDPEDGDLLLRVRRETGPGDTRPNASHSPAFEVLIRLTPRPLAARAWRVCNLPGALNATIARTMVSMMSPASHDRFLNLVCGSGTLMIERLALGPARLVLGGDRSEEALRCARENLRAAGEERRCRLFHWDAARLPLADASVNALCADLPYGMLMGSRKENERLYPAILADATRVAAPGAAMVLISHAVQVLDRSLAPFQSHWSVERRFEVSIPVRSGSLRPQVVLLRRTARRS